MTARFTRFVHEGDTVHLAGDTDAAEVSCPHEGVLRVRFVPAARHLSLGFPALAPKASFAVVGGGARPVQAHEEEGLLTVLGGGLELTLHLASGLWAVRDAEGHVLARATGVLGDPDSLLHKSRLDLEAPRGAAYLGLGSKVGPLDKRGWRFTFWNTDHFPYHTDSDPLYVSIPFCTVLQDGRATGLFLDEPWRTEIDVANRDASTLSWVSAGPELDLYVIAGPAPADVLRRYTDLTGRTPLPPLWGLGAAQSRWGYESEADIRDVIRGYRSRDLPLDSVYVDIDYMDAYKVFTWDRLRFPDPARMVSEARAQGVRFVPIIDPGVKLEPGYPVYEEALANDYLVRTSRGDPLVGEVWPNPAVFPDFTRAEVRDWWAGHFQALVDVGIGGVWNDMNEPACFTVKDSQSNLGEIERTKGLIEGKTLPYDARHGTRRHLEVHNVYALGMNAAAREGFSRAAPDRRPFMISRAGSPGSQRYGGIWTGDNSSAWSHLALSIPMLAGLGVSGVPLVGADVGGFIGDATGELLARWTQLGAFYPIMRNHSATGTRYQEPWRFGEEVLGVVREALKMRYRLLPTLYTLLKEAEENGLPPLRPLALHFPHDPDAVREDTQFLFGPHLLVAPVVRAGAHKRRVALPEGDWVELFNLADAGARHAGPTDVVAHADLDAVPVYLRAGGAIALTRDALHTSGANWDHLDWHVHAAAEVEGDLHEDAGDGYGEARRTRLSGGLRDGVLTLTRTVTGALPFEREKETLLVSGLPGAAEVTGARSWAFEDGVLRIVVDADWNEVTVRG